MTEVDYRALKEVILIHLEAADLCELTSSVLEYTISCLEHSPLRVKVVRNGCHSYWQRNRLQGGPFHIG